MLRVTKIQFAAILLLFIAVWGCGVRKARTGEVGHANAADYEIVGAAFKDSSSIDLFVAIKHAEQLEAVNDLIKNGLSLDAMKDPMVRVIYYDNLEAAKLDYTSFSSGHQRSPAERDTAVAHRLAAYVMRPLTGSGYWNKFK